MTVCENHDAEYKEEYVPGADKVVVAFAFGRSLDEQKAQSVAFLEYSDDILSGLCDRITVIAKRRAKARFRRQ